MDGTTGQDRKNYSDNQDRKGYGVDPKRGDELDKEVVQYKCPKCGSTDFLRVTTGAIIKRSCTIAIEDRFARAECDWDNPELVDSMATENNYECAGCHQELGQDFWAVAADMEAC